MKGQVIKGVGGLYDVLTDNGVIKCTGRGRIKLKDELYIGDYVEISLYDESRGAIEKIYPRKNKLTRPYITNIDYVIICIAPLPKPDFTLVDKLLINCLVEKITPILCINKIDIADKSFLKFCYDNFSGLCEIVEVSSKTGDGIPNLINMIKNKYVCMAGQSAVGKSSIINTIIGEQSLDTGELSKKIMRGKHCTRHVEIFDIGFGIRLADTCGFSVLETPNFEPSELSSYFTDFDEFAHQCKFKGCNHINEPNCMVKIGVDKGHISKDRYLRYVELYNQCLKKWRNRYE